MPRVRGKRAVQRYITDLPHKLAEWVLLPAAAAGAKVIAAEAKALSISDEVGDAIEVIAEHVDGKAIGRVLVRGKGAYIGPWLEYGTEPHFISVGLEETGGRTASRINRLNKDGDTQVAATLVINGKPVGKTVHHPGAKAHPFLRPARDTKEGEAIAAAQAYIDSRVRKGRILPATSEPDA